MSTTEKSNGGLEADQSDIEKVEDRSRWVAWSSLGFVVLQSLCTALIAASGFRTVIGAGALALSSTSLLVRFHQSAIRDPMLFIALLGAFVDLIVLWQVRRLRRRPASKWRQKPPSRGKLRMERTQFALSVLTLILVTAEMAAHKYLHGVFL